MNSAVHKQLSVAYLTADLTLGAGGLATSVPSMIDSVRRLGIKCELFGLENTATDHQTLDVTFPVHALPSVRLPGMRISPQLDSSLDTFAPDVVHLNGLWLYPSIATLRWRRRTNRPVVISPHGMLDKWALDNSSWKKRLALAVYEGRNLSSASCIHALNHSEFLAIRSLGFDNPIAIIPNGVDLPSPSSMRRNPSFMGTDRRRILLSLGRLHPKKGLLETVRAWAEAVRQEPTLAEQWVFVIAGWDDGRHLADLIAECTKLRVGNSIKFSGPVFGDAKDELFRCSEAFILASRSEGLPVSVLEAWSYGLPVAMTQECNLPDGFLCGAAIPITVDPIELAREILRLLKECDLSAMGRAGRTLVSNNYTWGNIGKDLMGVYAWLAGSGPLPTCVR